MGGTAQARLCPPYDLRLNPRLSHTTAAIAVAVDEGAVTGIEGRRAGATRGFDFLPVVALRGRRAAVAIGRRDRDIAAVGLRQVASVAIIIVAAAPLTFRRH